MCSRTWPPASPSATADALTGLGHIHQMQGRYEQATDHLQQSLRLACTTGNRVGELQSLTGLGDIHRMHGRYGQATEHYQRLLDLAHEIGDRNYEFEARQGLGRLQHATGHREQARTHWQHALDILTGLGVDQTDEEETTVAAIRTHLANLGHQLLGPGVAAAGGRTALKE